MKHTLVAQLFLNLQESEHGKARKFLHSPYHNRRDDVLELFDALAAVKPEAWESLTREQVYAKLYPETTFDRLAFNYLCSYLAERLEQFLVAEELRNNPLEHRLLRCKVFRKRGLNTHFDANAPALARDHAAETHRNAGWWLFEYQLQNEIFARQTLLRRDAQTNIAEATAALTQFFLLENLRWSTTARSLESLSREAQQPVPLAEETVRFAQTIPESEHPALALTLSSLLAQANPEDETQFQRLKNLLDRHADLFPPAESRDLYMAAINFAIRKHNRGDRAYTREAFELYKKALEINVLTENNTIPKYTYINILNLAQLVDEHNWARHFLEQGRALLPTADRENIYKYALAGFHFRRSEYQPVLELLREVEFSEVFINMDARKMLLRSYYELGEWQSLASLLESFKAYLLRRRDLGYHRDNYLNLIKFTKKVEKTTRKSSAARRKLAAFIEATTAVAEKDWLLSKIKAA